MKAPGICSNNDHRIWSFVSACHLEDNRAVIIGSGSGDCTNHALIVYFDSKTNKVITIDIRLAGVGESYSGADQFLRF